MGQSRAILSQAQQYYNSLNMSDIWSQTKTPRVNVFGTPGELKCWNCGKAGHGLDKCSEPRNESRIAENRQKWEASGGRSKSRKKGSGNSSGGGGATYERTKWAPPKPGESGVRYFDGSHHAYCKKKHNGVVCGWNTSHSTSFHKKWSELGTAFSLAQECPTHELVLKSGSGSHSSSSTRAASSSVSSSGGAATANSFKWCYCSLFLLFHHHSCSFFYPRIHLKERSKFTVSQKDPHDTQRFQKILMLKDRTVSKIATSQRSK